MTGENFLLAFIDHIRVHMPELVLFLSVGLGYLLGSIIKFGQIQLGGIAGTLIAALVIGQLGFDISPDVKSLFFAIFIFALGYAGGPQFFSNLNLKTLRLAILSLIEVVTVFTLVMISVYFMGFDAGTASGLIAGAATESAVIGTASEAIARLPITQAEVQLLQSNIATAYSVTYLFGVLSIVLFTSQFAPLILRVNLKEEADKLWQAVGGKNEDEEEANDDIMSSVYRVSFGQGRTIAQVNNQLGPKAKVEKIMRSGSEITVEPEVQLQKNDLVLVIGEPVAVANCSVFLGTEDAGTDKLNFVVGYEEAVLTNKLLVGQPLGNLQKDLRYSKILKSVYITGIKRGDHWLPLASELTLAYGDIIRFYGRPQAIADASEIAGRPIKYTDKTNLIFTATGIILGILVGSLGFHAGGIFVTLGTGGGVLVVALVCGWYQARHPDIAGIPAPAVAIMKDLGLSLFIACVGVSAGPSAIKLIQQYGIILPLVGICITLLPAIISLFVGRFLLKIDIPVLLGGIAGQQCSTPALSAVQSAAGNSTPVMGYTITYAISNVLLPLLGPVLVSAVSLMR